MSLRKMESIERKPAEKIGNLHKNEITGLKKKENPERNEKNIPPKSPVDELWKSHLKEIKNIEEEKELLIAFRKVDSIIDECKTRSGLDKLPLETIADIAKMFSLCNLIKLTVYFYEMKNIAVMSLIAKMLNESDLETIKAIKISEITELYKNIITPEYIQKYYNGEKVGNIEGFISKAAEITYEAIEAITYITSKLLLGIGSVAEDAVDFVIATVADLSQHPEIAEKVYDVQITERVSKALDNSFEGKDFVHTIGECSEKFGHIGTQIALTILATAYGEVGLGVIIAANVVLALAKAGEKTKELTETTGEYNQKNMICGLCSGIGSVAAAQLIGVVNETATNSEMFAKLMEVFGDLVPPAILENISGALESAFLGSIDALIYDAPEVITDALIKLLGIRDENEVDWKKLLKDMGLGAVSGVVIYELKSLVENFNNEIRKTVKAYFSEIKENSEYPELINDKQFKWSEFKKMSPEETKLMRGEYYQGKNSLIKGWESITGKEWPKYDKDFILNGKVIRRVGDFYDLHHIQPLGLGGKNVVENIAPIHAAKHFDHQGIHAMGSAYDNLVKLLGGKS